MQTTLGLNDMKINPIKELVCEEFEVSLDDIYSHRRLKTIVAARHTIYWLARHFTDRSYVEIAYSCNKCDHKSVILACRKIEKEVAEGKNKRAAKLFDILNKVRKFSA